MTAALPGRQGRVLLAYLALHAGRAVAREDLIDAVWDGRLPGAPQSALSSLLTGLRRVLGAGALAGRSHVALRLPAGSIDLERGRAAAARGEAALASAAYSDALRHAREALAIVSAPLLPELDGAWLDGPRADLDQLRVDQLELGARAALHTSPPELGIAERLAHELTEREPYRESGYALRMEALAAAGNVAEALRVFDGLRVRLRNELGATPAAALTGLHGRLLVQRAARAPTAAARATPLPALVARGEQRPFVGRDPELARLRARWSQAVAGEGGLALVTGEAGIGKTRLACRLAAEVHADGAAVLYGRADEETVVPYQPFAEALRHHVAHADVVALREALGRRLDDLRPLVPELWADVDPLADERAADLERRRFALFDAVSALLRHVAAARPLLIVLEDLHWADTPTLLLLRQAVREAEDARLLLLATYRDVELAPGATLGRVLGDLRREQVLARVGLGGLARGAIEALVAARGGGADTAARLREYTGGNPFFIEETLRSCAEAGTPTDALPVPESVHEVIRRRLERLGPRAVGVLTCAAVLGRDFALPALGAVAGEPIEALLDALEAAERAGLVVHDAERADRFTFSHALVRATLYEGVPPSRRGRMHLRAGEALEALRASVPAASAELAHHFFAGRDVGGAERAVRYGIEAARAAGGAHAYEDAAIHYERALSALAPADDERRVELLLALGAVRWQGSEPGARRACLEAAELALRRRAMGPLARAALGIGGRFYVPEPADPHYVGLLEEALAGAADDAVRARLLARLAETRSREVDEEPSIALAREAVEAARRAGDDAGMIAGLLALHATLLHIEHLGARRAVAEEAIVLADRHGARELGALARHWLIYDLFEAGELEPAACSHAELERAAHELRQPLYRHAALAWRGVWAQLAGRREEVERLAREGLRLAQRAATPTAHATFTGQLLVVRRQQERLPELLPALERLAEEGSCVLPWPAVLPLAHLQAGDETRARAAFETALESPIAHRLFWLTASAWLAEAAAALGHPAGPALRDRLSPYADRLVQAGFTGCWGPVRSVLGALGPPQLAAVA